MYRVPNGANTVQQKTTSKILNVLIKKESVLFLREFIKSPIGKESGVSVEYTEENLNSKLQISHFEFLETFNQFSRQD